MLLLAVLVALIFAAVLVFIWQHRRRGWTRARLRKALLEAYGPTVFGYPASTITDTYSALKAFEEQQR